MPPTCRLPLLGAASSRSVPPGAGRCWYGAEPPLAEDERKRACSSSRPGFCAIQATSAIWSRRVSPPGEMRSSQISCHSCAPWEAVPGRPGRSFGKGFSSRAGWPPRRSHPVAQTARNHGHRLRSEAVDAEVSADAGHQAEDEVWLLVEVPGGAAEHVEGAAHVEVKPASGRAD